MFIEFNPYFHQFGLEKRVFQGTSGAEKKWKSVSYEIWRLPTALNLRHLNESNMPVAQLEKIWQPNSDFQKNDCIKKKIFYRQTNPKN